MAAKGVYLVSTISLCLCRDRERGADQGRRSHREVGEPQSHRCTDWDKETPQTDRGHGGGDTPYSRVRGTLYSNTIIAALTLIFLNLLTVVMKSNQHQSCKNIVIDV